MATNYKDERETYGKCVPCVLIYQWSGAPTRREAKCNRCDGELKQAQLRTPGKRVFEKPLGKSKAAS